MPLETHPDWWNFELELSPHVEERMLDRGFSEVDLGSCSKRLLPFVQASAEADGSWKQRTTVMRGKLLWSRMNTNR